MSQGIAVLQLLAAQGARAQVDAVETAFGPLEFGGTMYRFAIPIISLAFLMMLGEQFLVMRAGQRPDWGRPFIRTAGFVLLLAAYVPFSNGIIGAVHMAGSIESAFTEITQGTGETSRSGVLAKRAKEFQELRKRIDEEMKTQGTPTSDNVIPSAEDIALVAESFMTSVIDDLLYVATWFSFTFAAFAVFAIKTLSGAITNILLEVGPLMIAFAALPGLTTRYLAAWCMALVEVTAWGPIASIILSLLARVNAKSAGVAILEDANYAEHIVLNFVYAGLFLAVPAITHMILSGAASSVGSTGMAAAMGGLAAAGRKVNQATRPDEKKDGGGGERGSPHPGETGGGGRGGGAPRAGDDTSASRQDSAPISSAEDLRAIHAKRAAIDKQRRGD